MDLFYKYNEKLNFLYRDQSTDFDDAKVVLKSFVNNANYVLVDQNKLSWANLFVRKYYLEGQPLQDGTHDKNDKFTGATVQTVLKDYANFDGKFLIKFNIRVDNLQNMVQIQRYDWMN